MRNIIMAVAFALATPFSTLALAVVETYEFSSEDLRSRYNDLIFELRCPKCQNQNLSDSDAPIAADLRALVYRLLNENKTDKEVKAYLVERYGDFVLYNPPVNKHTVILWLLPAAGLLAGAMVIFMLVRRKESAEKPVSLDGSQRQRLEHILSDKEQDN
ncbi:MAG: cytochrome c-type biogenesis protein CcmH [Flavobacteriales bacterium]|jgi:cytochrome c-type biogenesis protein CcmH